MDDAGLNGSRRWVTVAPAAAVLVLCAAVVLWGSRVVHYFGVFPQQVSLAMDMRLSYGLHFAVALVALLAVLYWRRSKNVLRLLLGVLTIDLVVFLLLSATAVFGGSGPTEPSRANAMDLFGNVGRTAMVDQGGAHSNYFHSLGLPNMNVFTKLPSVQGYGSLISTIYDDSTGTHPQSSLDPCRLADGTFTQLRLAVIAISSGQLAQSTLVHVPAVPNCKSAPPGPRADRYFGQILHVRTISLHGRGGQRVANGTVYFTLLDWNGRGVGKVQSETGANQMTFTIAGPSPKAAGFELSSKSPISIGDARVSETDASLPTYRLDSPYQEALDGYGWRLTDTVGTVSIFKATTVRAPVWLAPGTTNANVSKIRSAAWGDTWVNVRAVDAVTIVRSTAYLPGWRATALNLKTGASRSLTVKRNGLVQQVTVPSGTWQIHFHYHAPYIELSLTSTIVAFLLLFAVGGYLIVEDRRKREDKVAA
jgi:hypothetical protein